MVTAATSRSSRARALVTPAQARRADRRARLPDRQVRRVHPEVQGRRRRASRCSSPSRRTRGSGASVRDRLRALIFVHELGRARAASSGHPGERAALHSVPRCGDRDEAAPRRRLEGAKVALAGPILGSVGAAALDRSRGDRLRDASGLAFVGFFLNLFNLIPIVPLDGGRAAGALHRRCGSSAS